MFIVTIRHGNTDKVGAVVNITQYFINDLSTKLSRCALIERDVRCIHAFHAWSPDLMFCPTLHGCYEYVAKLLEGDVAVHCQLMALICVNFAALR